ncbi:MAG: polyprenol monophosphomannose synthase, partial [Candidatus Doudnabacteria bacterium]|nr:polyprenol monophosphomannose synthase [Candidatus Doudnabacteria bacterium]
MKAVIVLPTYNERENVQVIIPMLFDIARALDAHWELHVLVVDDTSPDKTAEVITGLQEHYPHLHLLMGKKQGLGRAYIRGMRHALNALQADVVFEMDADLSHDPYKIPEFLAAIDAGADFVIGSRYVPGGSIPANWPTMRILNSKLANLLARYLVGIYGVKDCTGGFRAIRSHVLRAANLHTIRIVGYAFQVVLLQRAVLLNAKIVEVPIHFQDRTIGVSKMRLKDQVESVISYFQLRLHSFSVRYGLKTLTILSVMGFTAVMLL